MTGLLDALLERLPNLELDVVCEVWQINLTSDWAKTQRVYEHPKCKIHPELLKNAPRWSTDPAKYDDGHLLEWDQLLLDLPALQQADIVISDNLAAVLKVRPDALIMGSFIWSDILQTAYPNHRQIAPFVTAELELLESHRPYNLCVGAIVMPALQKRCKTVPLPWFGQDDKWERDVEQRKNRLAVLAGATSAAQEELEKLCHQLVAHTDFEIAIPDRLMNKMPAELADRLVPFDFTLEAFASCDAVICRPGVGTITDCIVTNTPMLLFYESGNSEVQHNARRLSELGLGLELGNQLEPTQTLSQITKLLTPANYRTVVQALAEQAVNGFEKAVDWILNYKS